MMRIFHLLFGRSPKRRLSNMLPKILYVHDDIVHNKNAARIILPLVFDSGKPTSVLDVGCGLGTWLSVCDDLGVKDYLGIDGDYVERGKLTIPESNFKSADLRNRFSLGRKFDLVICLEVAEHIPESSANLLIESIIEHGDHILFSAAIPGQDGQNHINEQWLDYWQAKFRAHGMYFHDLIRPKIWNDENVDWWYRQNIFLINSKIPTEEPLNPLSIVHPKLFEQKNKYQQEYYDSLKAGKQGVKLAVKILIASVIYKIKNFWS